MKHTFVKLLTGDIEIDHIREMYEDLKATSFQYITWKPRIALIEKNGKTSWLYTGQNFDPNYIDLVENGWTNDHCEICSISISDNKNQYTVTEGYFNGNEWICKDCYETILATNNIEKKLAELPKYEK